MRAELCQVGALQAGHPGVGAQPAAKLASASVDGVDAGRPGIEQSLGKATSCSAEVESYSAGSIDPEGSQGMSQLDRPAQQPRLPYLYGGAGSHARPRAFHGHPVDKHSAFLDRPNRIINAGKPAPEQSNKGDKRGTPGGSHDGFLLELGPKEHGPSPQGGPRAPYRRMPNRPQPTAAASQCAGN